MSLSEPRLAHVVFFTLKEKTEAARKSLVAACCKYLTDHPGTVHFSAGARAQQYARPVNDAEFDVSLVLVFATAADHDRYQASERHLAFVAEQSAHWERVRVFDSFA